MLGKEYTREQILRARLWDAFPTDKERTDAWTSGLLDRLVDAVKDVDAGVAPLTVKAYLEHPGNDTGGETASAPGVPT